MARHFLQLYLLIVATLALASWGQEQLLEFYARDSGSAAEQQTPAAVLTLVEERLRSIAPAERAAAIEDLATDTGIDVELFAQADIAGADTLARLARGELAIMSAADGITWALKRLAGEDRVLAFRYSTPDAQRTLPEWLLTLALYGAIALVLMTWLWPLTRDLRRLERSAMRFGDRNWSFEAGIRPGSQLFPLAEAFRRMAARIDDLIRSQQDMSHALSHEIKTPLARMRFEVEMARTAATPARLDDHLSNVDTDIAELDAFLTATLDYAILERAEVALNLDEHDFTTILPAVTESARRSAPAGIDLVCEVADGANHVWCDAHLMETVLRNLLYNALRYARSQIRVRFVAEPTRYTLEVEDDGPGIPPADRRRVFGSFVQLGGRTTPATPGGKVGYGLGLAIVKRIVEWHDGEVSVKQSDLGGAGFSIRWPTRGASRPPKAAALSEHTSLASAVSQGQSGSAGR